MKSVGRHISNISRRYRRGRTLTQKNVCSILGIRHTNVLSRWENGNIEPSLRNAIRLSLVYGKPVEELFCDLHKELHEELCLNEEYRSLAHVKDTRFPDAR